MLDAIKRFFARESAPTLLFMVMLLLAMAAANSPLVLYYDRLHTPVVTLVVNDGLMTLFFLSVGIEIKQELKKDTAAPPSQILLPVVAALGGVIVPALIYSYINHSTPGMRGWAIPTATDIVFSLGILSIFGNRVPPALRVFLLSIAVFDDLVAIGIIALFYTEGIKWLSFAFSCGCVVLLAVYNRYVQRMPAYVFAGCALWLALFDAGISPTIAGAILGLLMPINMGKQALHILHAWVAFAVIPVFVFANSGVSLGLLSSSLIINPVSLGIAGGLFVGKQCGVFASSLLLIKMGLAKLPHEVTWLQLYAVSILCGIGFTMSLFIGSLAFSVEPLMLFSKAGVLIGSLASAATGIICMALSCRPNKVKV